MHAVTRTLILLSMLLAACGAPPPTAVSAIQFTITPGHLAPAQWRIQGGGLIQIQLINQTPDDHEWVLLLDPPKEPYDSAEAAQEWVRLRVAGGQTLTSEFRAPAAPGEYAVTCASPGHLEEGEVAKLLVVQPGY